MLNFFVYMLANYEEEERNIYIYIYIYILMGRVKILRLMEFVTNIDQSWMNLCEHNICSRTYNLCE